MKLVILDGYTINPGDLDWKEFETLGELKVYDRTPPDKVIERVKEADILLTNKTKITSEIIENLPNLKYIGELATGFDNIDIKAAAEKKIPVCNVPGYSNSSVAQLTWAYILNFYSGIHILSEQVHAGDWVKSKDFSFGAERLKELNGKTLGLVGFGRIGSEVAAIALAFGMKVIAVVRNPEKYQMKGVEITKDLNKCFKTADMVSLHLPFTEENRGMVDKNLLNLMKPSAYFINTARGALINEQDLADALHDKTIAGAALDVLSQEPPQADNPLLNAPNCIITPHIAWATKEARIRLMKIAVENVKAFFNGKPQNVVNDMK